MIPGEGFWDSSALVPLCVLQHSSQFVEQQLKRFHPVVWWGTSVEVQSAICRLHRAIEITDEERQWGAERLKALRQSWIEMQPGMELRESAERLLERHALRAGDSLQLAAALVWCGGRPAKRVFVCADERLSKAARAEGFTVVEVG